MDNSFIGRYVSTKDNYCKTGESLLGKIISIDLVNQLALVQVWHEADDHHTKWLKEHEFALLHDINLAHAWMQAHDMLDGEGFRI